MVADISLTSAIDQQSQTTAAKASLAEDFTQFLTLLTTQLQNQDPLSPMDSTEFTNQLVAFTQVEQQINSNEKLDNLVALGLSDAMGNAQSFVGQNINYISSEFFFDGTPQTMRYSLPSTAATATMRIYNEDGAVVYSESVTKSSGAHDITWNGQLTGGGIAKDGTYTIEIDAVDEQGDAITATTAVSGKVKGVEAQDGVIYLLVGERAVALANVLNSEADNDTSVSENVTSALNYVGLDVGYESNEFIVTSDKHPTLDYTLEDDADRAKIHIYDDTGNLVFTDNVDTSKGNHSYEWASDDYPAGEYTFQIDAVVKAKDTVKNDKIKYTGDGGVDVEYTLQETYDNVKVTVLDWQGRRIYSEDIDRTTGAHDFTWDGKDGNNTQAPAGDYTIEIVATGEEDESIAASSSATGRVTGVEVSNGVVFLQIGNTKTVPLSEIDSVSVPNEPTTPTTGS